MKRHRLHFKIIGALISLSFITLVLLQGYWLLQMYQSAKEENRKKMQQAIERADHKELFIRLSVLKEQGLFKSYTMNLNESLDNEMTPADVKDKRELESKIAEVYRFLGDLPNLLMQNIHKIADPLLPVNYRILDSLLNTELADRNIHTPAFTRLYTNAELGQEKNIPRKGSDDPRLNAYCFPYLQFAGVPQQYLYVYVINPEQEIITQMSGILLSSSLVLLLTIFTFIYLFRTLIRQKTIEELKTDFTNNMTHELKTPISSSYAAIDSLLQSPSPIPAQKLERYLYIAKGQLTHLSGLVEQLLTLAVENRSTFKLIPEPILLPELLHQLTDQYTITHPGRCTFTLSCPCDAEIVGDRTHVYNILNNLLENALKHGQRPVMEISITVTPLPDKVSIQVTDNGIGMDPKELTRIFDKFYRIPAGDRHNTKGYGLGLYYVKGMMERHEGEIRVTSAPGKGTCFTLLFKI